MAHEVPSVVDSVLQAASQSRQFPLAARACHCAVTWLLKPEVQGPW